MKRLYFVFTVVLLVTSGSNATALLKQVDGVATTETQFCSGVILTFVCNIPASSYIWEIGPLLNEMISIGNQIKTVNGTSLSAQGQSDTRTSSLTLTTSVQWNGHEIVCYENANRAGGVQTSTISVWDPPSAPVITAVGSLDLSSFTLTVTPPVTSPGCVSLYSLTVRQDGVVVFTGSFGNDSLLDGNIDLKTITGDNLAVSTCQYKYSFELTPVGGNESSGEQEGNPNLNAVVSRASQYSIKESVITWSVSSFPEVHSTCIMGYEFSVNDEVQGFINVDNPSLEISSFNMSDICDETFITIRPVVEINNTVLANDFINTTSCEPSSMFTTSGPEMNRFPIGAIIGSVIAVVIIGLVILALVSGVVIYRMKLKLSVTPITEVASKPENQTSAPISHMPADNSKDEYAVPNKIINSSKTGPKQIAIVKAENEELIQASSVPMSHVTANNSTDEYTVPYKSNKKSKSGSTSNTTDKAAKQDEEFASARSSIPGQASEEVQQQGSNCVLKSTGQNVNNELLDFIS